ncbi:MAG: chromosome segregation ATPase [Bacteroidetes bacterium]|nr:chromosome segregation ATPase [Bacteroidota bacterium]
MITAILNNKGGVAKTTTALNLGHAFTLLGKSVLIVDLDRQMNSSFTLGATPEDKTIYDALLGRCSLKDCLKEHPDIDNLYYIPSGNIDIELELNSKIRREEKLKVLLSGTKEVFDIVLIDCPPSLGILSINAMTAADNIIIPLQLEPFAYLGTGEIITTFNEIKKELNPSLEILGYLRTLYDPRLKQTQEFEKLLFEKAGENKIFKTVIKKNVALAECNIYRKTIFQYNPEAQGAENYMALAKEILGK